MARSSRIVNSCPLKVSLEAEQNPEGYGSHMTMMVAAPPLSVAGKQQREVDRTTSSCSSQYRSLGRAHALLVATIYETARPLRIVSNSVCVWRSRFEVAGVPGVGQISPDLERTSCFSEGIVAPVVQDALHALPDGDSTN